METYDAYSREELDEAKVAIISIIHKCEKALPKLKEKSSQQTLLKRRIKAMYIALSLIEKETIGFDI
ncbi:MULTISPECIES: hypothetical protein [Flagellimonas]|uniref:Uncharacterized protein n=1 Tax=Flagellimonas hadalis TaxID=2597517 RepID=A0A5N5IV23_9FLAO|nr:hypothetical protein [Allomuricauda hadalis]KAB5486537.1 hypothetical protein FOT42_013200 [Allomuricauda hadalis]